MCSAISEMPGRQQRLRERAALGARGDRRLEPGERRRVPAAPHLVSRVLDDPLEHAHAGARSWVIATSSVEARGGAPVVDGRLRLAHAGLQRVDPARHVDRRSRVEHGEVALRARLAREDPSRRLGVVRRRTACELLGAGARQPDVLWRDLVGVNLQPVDLHDARCARGTHLVQTVGAGHYQRLAGAQLRQRAGDRVQERGVRHADHLPRCARGVGQRAEEVEDRAYGELLAHGDDEPRRAVMRGGEHEAKTDLVDAPRDGLRIEVDPHAEGLEEVGRAGQAGGRAVAVLGHRAPRSGGDQRRSGRDVEGRPAAAGAGGVDQVVAAGPHRAREPSHGRGQADQLVDRLALGAQRDQHRRRLHLGRVALHDLGQDGRGLLGGEVAPRGQRVDRLSEDRQGSSPAGACRRG